MLIQNMSNSAVKTEPEHLPSRTLANFPPPL